MEAPQQSQESTGASQELRQQESAQPPIAPPPARPRRYRRRIALPLTLFVLTCLSTFLVGVSGWLPHVYFFGGGGVPVSILRLVETNWKDGLLYMACVLVILLSHEMGHFVMTLVYRVRASLPYFIPLPISPIGTMGAVIGMDGLKANRRQIFDIGLAGPLAGLVVAVPIIWYGVATLDLEGASREDFALDLPLAMRVLVDYLHPGQYNPTIGVPISRVNAFFMAGWVGLLVTGLNMLPVSQLDGGHVTYGLFGKGAHWIARFFMLAAFLYMGSAFFFFGQPPQWMPMALLVLLMGTDHPPTSDDTVRLGPGRGLLGAISLAIPIFCFVPNIRL